MNRKPKQLTKKVYEIALNTGGSFYPETNSATLQKFAEAIGQLIAPLFPVSWQTLTTK